MSELGLFRGLYVSVLAARRCYSSFRKPATRSEGARASLGFRKLAYSAYALPPLKLPEAKYTQGRNTSQLGLRKLAYNAHALPP